MVHEDYERDFLKDVIYLEERALAMENEAQKLLEDMHRLNARIIVIKQENEQHDGEVRLNVLPF
jgi:PHD/YefM family antitoxin component YafN of YafNO toxin-antitoxin module